MEFTFSIVVSTAIPETLKICKERGDAYALREMLHVDPVTKGVVYEK